MTFTFDVVCVVLSKKKLSSRGMRERALKGFLQKKLEESKSALLKIARAKKGMQLQRNTAFRKAHDALKSNSACVGKAISC